MDLTLNNPQWLLCHETKLSHKLYIIKICVYMIDSPVDINIWGPNRSVTGMNCSIPHRNYFMLRNFVKNQLKFFDMLMKEK